jgi:hypothetical protein
MNSSTTMSSVEKTTPSMMMTMIVTTTTAAATAARTDLLGVVRFQVAPPVTPWSRITVLKRQPWRFKQLFINAPYMAL